MTGSTVGLRSRRSSFIRWSAGAIAVAFGLATVISGGRVLFGGPAARSSAGDIVPFVLMFNFGAGFAYVAAGLGAVARRTWAARLAQGLAVATVLVFVAFGVHMAMGGSYEMRTVGAMTVRSAFWVVQALVLSRLLTPKGSQPTD